MEPVLLLVANRSAAGRATGFLAGAVVVVALVLVPVWLITNYLGAPYWLDIATLTLLYSGFGMSANVSIRAGYWPAGQAGFAAIGAYASAVICTRYSQSLFVGLACGAVGAGVVSWIVGRVTLRLSGTYFVLATFALGEVVQLVAVNQNSVLGGAGGIAGLPSVNFLSNLDGLSSTATQDLSLYYVTLILACLIVGILWSIYRSTAGSALDLMGLNPMLAISHGIDTVRYRVFAFTVCGALTGLCGALYGDYLQLASPDAFTYTLSVNILLMNVIGGTSSIIGPVLGSLLIVPLPEVLRGAGALYAELSYGVVVVVVILLVPGGLLGVGRYISRIVGYASSRH